MTVETVTYISDLNDDYPGEAETSTLHEGNDHIRNIKKGILTTFPNVTGAVTATHTELNYCDITTLGTMQASKALTASSGNVLTVPSGGTVNIASGGALQLAGTAVTATAAQLNTVGGLATFGIQFNLDYGANGTYTLDQYASFAYTIVSAVYQTASGTIAADVKINGTSVTGLSALSLSGTEGGPTSASGANSVAAGDTVAVTLSSNSSAVGVSLKLNCVRV